MYAKNVGNKASAKRYGKASNGTLNFENGVRNRVPNPMVYSKASSGFSFLTAILPKIPYRA